MIYTTNEIKMERFKKLYRFFYSCYNTVGDFMTNTFPYSDSNKRYHTLDYYYRHKYGCKVFKVSLNAGFTCPNRDGTVGVGGCIYCSSSGSGEFGGNPKEDLVTQFETIKNQMLKKWPDNMKYIGYFQAGTNTYADVSVLRKKYESILNLEHVVGLHIATRPDAISDECLDLLSEINQKTDLTIELGLQTIHEKTAILINRCHSLDTFARMVEKLRKRKIAVVVHIINGLPYETPEMMIETAQYLAKLDIQGVKIHMLSILKNTRLAKIYEEHPFPLLSLEEYVQVTVRQLEYLPPEMVIHRITGDPKKEDLVAPNWLLKKFCVINEIDKKMAKENIYQGDLYKK